MSFFATLAEVTLDFSGQAVDVLPGVTAANADTPSANFGRFLGASMGAIMTVSAIMALVLFLWAALTWITAGDDKGKVQKARDRIANAIIGLIVLSASAAIYTAVQSFLGINVLDFRNNRLKSAGELVQEKAEDAADRATEAGGTKADEDSPWVIWPF